MATYVQGYGSDTWHWCRNCSNYPSSIAKRRETPPTTGEKCNQCMSKQRDGSCRS